SINQNKQSHSNWNDSIDKQERELYIVKKLEYPVTQTTLNDLERTLINSKKGVISKLSFNWFKKSKLTNTLKEINAKFPLPLQNHVDKHTPIISSTGDLVDGFVKHLNFIQGQKTIQEEIKNLDSQMLLEIESLEVDLEAKKQTLENTIINQKEIQQRVDEITSDEPNLGLEILKLSINEKLRNA